MSNSAPLAPVEDEELDFMSDEFLIECTKKDVRPGLLYNSRDKRQHELKKKQLEDNIVCKAKNKKSLQQLEDVEREEKLKQEIDSKNKGFLLLEKMGYKPGMSIGPRNNGLKVPLSIEMKRTRGGLGENTKREEKRKKMDEFKEELNRLSDPVTYRSRLRELEETKDILRDLKKAQSSCQNLDRTACLDSPAVIWFWPAVQKMKSDSEDETELADKEVKDENDDEEINEPEPREKLEALVQYLRENYFYCLWCGTAYDNADDLNSSCPGSTREDH